MTEAHILRAAVLSADEAFRDAFSHRAVRREMELILDLPLSMADASAGHLEDLRDQNPDLVFLDIEGDPDLGCRLAQYVNEVLPGSRLVACGPMQSPEFLLRAMQSGVAEYLTKPVMSEDLVAAVSRGRRALAPREVSKKSTGRLLAFFSPKRGSGSTTVASNLAIQLHRLTGKRTVLVDLDLELGECALFLGLEPRYNVADLAANLHRIDRGLLASYVEPHESGIQLLAAPYHTEKGSEVDVDQLVRILKLLKEHYDYVIVDSPKGLTPRTIPIFEQANQIFLISQLNVPTVQNIQRSETLLERLRRNNRSISLLVNRYDPNAEITLDDLERSTEMKVFWTVGNDYEAASYSMNSGKPLILGASSSCAREIEGLAAKISGIAAGDSGSRGRLFGSIFGRLKDRLASPGDYGLPPLPVESENG
ncbi:MAG TPA: AAA family ATPase [Gemmatimonadota bacterium]|nr:AAA family ATPase [Gemmatimonadota bacterium]